MVLFWETRPPATYPNAPLSHIILILKPTSLCPILIMPSIWLGSDKYQFYKSSVWLHWGLNPWSPACERPVLYLFGHRSQSVRRSRTEHLTECYLFLELFGYIKTDINQAGAYTWLDQLVKWMCSFIQSDHFHLFQGQWVIRASGGEAWSLDSARKSELPKCVVMRRELSMC